MSQFKKRRSLLETLESRVLLDASPAMVELVYDLNVARSRPAQYALLHPSASALNNIPPAPPLAIHDSLMRSASLHASEMSLHDYLAHQSAVDGRWPNQRVRDALYDLPASFLAQGNGVEAIAAGAELDLPDQVLESWLANTPGGGNSNRDLLLGNGEPFSQFREIGVGMVRDVNDPRENVWVIHAATRDSQPLYLTGVVYSDSNLNGRFEAGEGIGGVTVTVGPFTTVTQSAGNWSLRVAGGLHEVIVQGGPFSTPRKALASVIDKNVEVDFLVGQSPQVNFRSQSPWTNPLEHMDVNGDGKLTPLDALLVINELNANGSQFLSTPSESASPPPYYDASGDQRITPLDALLVINALNDRQRS